MLKIDTYRVFTKSFFIHGLCTFIGLFLLMNCQNKSDHKGHRKIDIRQKDGRYAIYKEGKVFTIKGASGYTNLAILNEFSGNTIRVWDTTNLGVILDSARANHLMVIVGLPVFNEADDQTFYQKTVTVNSQYTAFKSIVSKYKNDPAILMWCLGNELPFPNGLFCYKFYRAFNSLTEMIRQEDPDHPITTTISTFNNKYLFNLVTRCNIDIISFNIFGSIKSIRDDLKNAAWFWQGPYMITEWGIDGAWSGTGAKQTAWGAFIEPTSKKKAEIYTDYYSRYIPLEDPRLLGTFVFFWGSKQETTHTWFSLFDEYGNKTELVNKMRNLWTGKLYSQFYPQIEYMLINQKGAQDNIMVSAQDTSTARLILNNNTDAIEKISWQVFNEDWYLINKKANPKKAIPITKVFTKNKNLSYKFCAPATEGPYRLFATVYDHYGNISTCNIPFYVLSDN